MTIDSPGGRCAVVVHGGAEDAPEKQDRCDAAAALAIEALRAGQPGLEAVIAAVTQLEDDGRFNAGRGASLRLDGHTVERCASVMDTRGVLGAVAATRRIRNPVRAARAVAASPHRLLVGEGADRHARACGLPEDEPPTESARRELAELAAKLQGGEQVLPRIPNDAFLHAWHFAMPWPEALERRGHGTVGAVVRDADGHFAVALSTGGSARQLLGRVGDTPLVGCGFHCGAHGAVAVTSVAEFVLREVLAFRVHGWIAEGHPLQRALDDALALFEPDVDLGLIAVGRTEAAAASNRRMPRAAREC